MENIQIFAKPAKNSDTIRYCHTRSNLGILAMLEILQSWKLDTIIIFLTSMEARKLKFGG